MKVALLTVCLLLPAPAVFAQSQDFVLPILQSTDTADVGLALSNPTLHDLTVTLTARSYSGQILTGAGITNPATLLLPASGQLSRRAIEIFGPGIRDTNGWVQIRAPHGAVRGFFLLFDRDLTYIDGTDLSRIPERTLVFPKVTDSTRMVFINGAAENNPVRVKLFENNGSLLKQSDLVLAAHAGFSGRVQDFESRAAGFDGYAIVESSLGLIGVETYSGPGDNAALRPTGEAERFNEGYIPHFAVGGGYQSRVGLVNPNGTAQRVQITAAGLTGGSRTVERLIPANGRLDERVDTMFGLQTDRVITGYIRVLNLDSYGGLLAYLEYGNTDQKLLSTVPAESGGYSDLFFSQVAEGSGYYTGLAIVNPHPYSVSLRMDVFGSNGDLIDSNALSLPPGSYRARLLRDLFDKVQNQLSGYVRITASRPIFALQVFGRDSMTVLANVSVQGSSLERLASSETVTFDTGGQVVTKDGAISISIPPLALQFDTAVTLRSLDPLTLPPPGNGLRVTMAVEINPSQTHLEIPALIRIPTLTRLGAGTVLPVLVLKSGGTRFEQSGFNAVVDETGLAAWAGITYFGTFALSVPNDGFVPAAALPEFMEPPPPTPVPPVPAPQPVQRVVVVRAGGSVQAALDAAQPGDIIELEAGATFTGPFVLPRKSGNQEIVIRSTAHANLPAAGSRVQPSDTARMPRIIANSDNAIHTAPGAHDYRLEGLEIAPSPGGFLSNVVLIGAWPRAEVSPDDFPRRIVIDRCYIHGDPQRGSLRGVAVNGIDNTVTGSYVSDFKEVNRDTQAIAGWNGPGPYLIENNYLEAGGENVLFGGADPSMQGIIPSDIRILRNRIAKPLSWKAGHSTYQGTRWTVKNLLELKNARRVLISGNVLEYTWAADQNGYAVLFTPRNQDGTAPWSTIEDVEFVNNIVRHTTSGVNILGYDNIYTSQRTQRLWIHNNVFEDVGAAQWNAAQAYGLGAGSVFQLLDGAKDVVIEHNTAFQTTAVLVGSYTSPPGPHSGQAHEGLVFRNNLMMNGTAGVLGADVSSIAAAFNRYFPGAIFEKNVLIGGNATKYPSGNFFPASIDAVGFVDYRQSDYHLSPTSPYRNAGSDSQNIGVLY